MKCRKCGTQMEMTVVSETKKLGLIKGIICIILLFIPIIGWIALFKLFGFGRKVKGKTYAVCPNCGFKRAV